VRLPYKTYFTFHNGIAKEIKYTLYSYGTQAKRSNIFYTDAVGLKHKSPAAARRVGRAKTAQP
jgi:hypothetical protein